MIVYLLITAFALCVVHVIFNFNKKARMIRRLPGPRESFIVGNGNNVKLSPKDLWKFGRTCTSKWRGIFRIWSFPFAFVNIYNPEDIEVIVSTMKHNDKSIIYKFLKPWLRNGLLLSNGTQWQKRRKILTPTFHFNILRQFCVVLEENSIRLVNSLNTVLGKPVDVTPILSEFTLFSICETAMGTRLDKESSECAKSYKESIYKLGTTVVERFVKMHLYVDAIFNLTSIGKAQKKLLSDVHTFTEKVIKDRKQNFRESDIKADDVNDENQFMGSKKRTAMLDLLISAQKEGLIDDEGIQEEVDTFMFEGHDTTASGLTYFLMLLAINKHAQDKIVEELKEVLGDDKKNITIEDLAKMRYLECCIKESLRLYPPVPFISRAINETVTLSNYTIPAGTICTILIYDLHRREDLFENPEKFDPERFLPENSTKRHPYAYIPFSAGPRNCIGQKFAIYEMKIAVSAILRNYELLPVTRPNDLEIVSDLVLRNNGPVYVKFIKRT